VIQKYIENPLANRLLTGEFGGGDHIKVDYIQDEIRFDNGA
jgi:C-terminal, D2-small domain, of ClpB protein.